MKYSTLTLAILVAITSTQSHADSTDDDGTPTVQLEALQATVSSNFQSSLAFGDSKKASHILVKKEALKTRPTTLGDALDGELGIHSNQFGGGASAPIIRGQEGKRITILQNNADVIDMAHLSPDHAVMVDTILARQVEVVRGVNTLLYKSGNHAGVVNVIDQKIPAQLPTKAIEGEAGIRFNTGNDEKLVTGGLTVQTGSNLVWHVEGLHKDAKDYKTPAYILHEFTDLDQLNRFSKAPDRLAGLQKEYEAFKNGVKLHWRDENYFIRSEEGYQALKDEFTKDITDVKSQTAKRLPESWAKSKAGSFGVSWVGNNGYIGMAVSERKDKYGLPAHNHLYEGCEVISIFDSLPDRPYLARYPQLIDESDVNYINPRPNCVKEHVHANGHSHGLVLKHEKLAEPHVDLTTRRYDVRGEWHNPIAGISKVRGNLGYVDYQHQEKEAHVVNTSFKNKGKVARLELTHDITPQLKALWGIQHTEQDNSALSPQNDWRKQQLLTQNQLKNSSLFASGRYDVGKLQVEFGTRLEKQKVAMDYDLNYIDQTMRLHSVGLRDKALEDAIAYAKDATNPHKKTAHSYALGLHYEILPTYTLSFNVARQERLPNPQELYTHGMHLATNSFEIGNRHLTKEKTNNYELSLNHQGDKLDFKLSGYLYDFDNYIYLQTINEHLGTAKVNHYRHLRINRYDQAPAKFYGFEGSIGYQFTPKYHASVFGDTVKGRLHDLPDIVTDFKAFCFGPCQRKTYGPQEDRYTPRLPPMRLGTRLKAHFDDQWSANLEYIRTFEQDKISKFESPTQGHDMLNLGIDYHGYLGGRDYSVFMRANNLLNERVYAHETFLPYIPQMGRHFSLGVNFRF
ncbi:hypothetical protein MOVS_08480 [Moraxella ovis]|uniref:Probable TonB-dependent receptor NMB0964 n=1 Tax=Moraxella ovis TaxID=29433 RepID=A0A160GGF4_9GAMM|nr:TonB-dependent receptor [Moraxella ovis]ANB92006.1 hypothetical protein MOVS_08480 [Moraxella ovis]SPX86763.1 Probable TonB-dependent receptor NMB0964 precursor [Moraxella ovis]STY87749.1 Probable TonB-dependent receptor NMB0964 precursor [Moraxella ovis]STZ05646.1 Probable TonB-dependent receptor NMB0964 precursor [Moraxella ovis]